MASQYGSRSHVDWRALMNRGLRRYDVFSSQYWEERSMVSTLQSLKDRRMLGGTVSTSEIIPKNNVNEADEKEVY